MNETEISEDLAGALYAAAHAAPPYHGDLALVRARGRSHRHRRAAGLVGVAALAVAVVVAVPVVVSGQAAPPAVVATGADPPVAVPLAPLGDSQQRLITDVWGHVINADGFELPAAEGETPEEAYERLGQTPGAVGVVGGGYAEVRPDGQVVPINVNLPGIDGVYDVASMPDGRLAVLGYRAQLTDEEHEDSSCPESVAILLLVVELDGSVSLSRDVGTCQMAQLLDADSQTAYLVQGTRLVAHDLATGDEQTLLDSAYVLGADYPEGAVAGGRVAVVNDGSEVCGTRGSFQLAVLTAELATGATSEHPIRETGCGVFVGALQFSPDGRYAAVSYDDYEGSGTLDGDGDDTSELRLAVVDLDAGEVVTDQAIVDAAEYPDPILNRAPYSLTTNRGAIVGFAWQDERSLLVASYQTPAVGVHRLADVVEVETITMP
jgi:hypothetical protein